MTEDTFPVLYVLARNDLASMNPGKLGAQSNHCGSAFDYHFKYAKNITKENGELYRKWQNETDQGFGTVLVLEVNETQMNSAVKIAEMLGFVSGIIHDPSYPYIVDKEVSDQIPMENDAVDKNGNKIPRFFKNDSVVIHRPENTCSFIFGNKDDPILQAVVNNFGLYP